MTPRLPILILLASSALCCAAPMINRNGYGVRGVAPINDVTAGLVSYYTFSGNANPVVGTYTGTPNMACALTNGVKGESNGAYYFGPTVGQIVFTNFFSVFNGTNAGSISWWEKPSTAYNDGVAHFTYNVGDENGGATISSFAPNKWSDSKRYCGFYGASGDHRAVVTMSSALWSSGVWHHWVIAWTNTGSTIVYVDGASVATNGVATKGVNTTGAQLTLGSYTTSQYPYLGTLDNFRTYSIMLTPTQVNTIYNFEKP